MKKYIKEKAKSAINKDRCLFRGGNRLQVTGIFFTRPLSYFCRLIISQSINLKV